MPLRRLVFVAIIALPQQVFSADDTATKLNDLTTELSTCAAYCALIAEVVRNNGNSGGARSIGDEVKSISDKML